MNRPDATTGQPEAAGPGERRPRPVRHVHRDVAAAPFIVIWEATRACPLACLHCRAEARPDRDPAELTTAEATGLMRQITAFGRPAPLFVITGGDPFERPDLYDLIRHARDLGLSPSVSPSATPALTPGNLTRLRDAGASVISLSLDGATAGRHDDFRGFDGVFTRTLNSWQAARDTGLKVPLTEIYRTSPVFTSLRDPDLLAGRCGACEFRTVCGGSRSRAYATTGDVLAEEPWCSYRPGSFPYQDGLGEYLGAAAGASGDGT